MTQPVVRLALTAQGTRRSAATPCRPAVMSREPDTRTPDFRPGTQLIANAGTVRSACCFRLLTVACRPRQRAQAPCPLRDGRQHSSGLPPPGEHPEGLAARQRPRADGSTKGHADPGTPDGS